MNLKTGGPMLLEISRSSPSRGGPMNLKTGGPFELKIQPSGGPFLVETGTWPISDVTVAGAVKVPARSTPVRQANLESPATDPEQRLF
jgi:hypothetical protein